MPRRSALAHTRDRTIGPNDNIAAAAHAPTANAAPVFRRDHAIAIASVLHGLQDKKKEPA
jgi:hypothetical protein